MNNYIVISENTLPNMVAAVAKFRYEEFIKGVYWVPTGRPFQSLDGWWGQALYTPEIGFRT